MKRLIERVKFEADYIREHKLMALVGYIESWCARFPERPLPKTAKLDLYLGANRIEFVRSGTVVADMTLVRITWNSCKETEVVFRETGPLRAERTMSRKYPGHTVKEEQEMDSILRGERREY